MSYLFNFLSGIWSFFATKTITVLGLICTAFYHSIMGAKIQAFERKHSHWKLSQILPMFLMVFLCINVTSVQAASFQVHTVCPVKMKAPHFSSTHLAFLFNKWKESLNTHSNFEKLLNSIKPHQLFQVGLHCANKWEEFLAHEALHCSCQSKFVQELFSNNSSFANYATQKDVPSWTDMTIMEETDGLYSLLSAVIITHVPQTFHWNLKNF